MDSVTLEDTTLRDGLQSEKIELTVEDKVSLFEMLVNAGVRRIQVGSFVHPGIVPQMADIEELIRQVKAPPEVRLSALVLNSRGLDRELKCGMKHMNLSVSASDTHSRKNVNRSFEKARSEMIALTKQAVSHGMAVQAGVQCAFGCVYEGAIPEEHVLTTLQYLSEAGAGELYLADTSGMAHPRQITRMVEQVHHHLPGETLSLHLHDTRGLGLANIIAGYEAGVRGFDVSTGGLGGCPFVKGAAGNVPTEDAVNLFARMGVDTGIRISGLCRIVEWLESRLGRTLPGRMCRVLQHGALCD